MLMDFLSGGMPLVYILLLLPILLISLTFHEYAHGYVAYRLGDMTAKNEGRLTLNPLKHLDPVGTIVLLIAGIGWAKPVPVNPYYFKNKKKGMMLVSVAGPLSNILMAFVGVFIFEIVVVSIGERTLTEKNSVLYLLYFLRLFFSLNLNLAIFNILPVPPLDGSKIMSGVLPTEAYFRYMQYERMIGIVFLFVVIVFPQALGTVLGFFTVPVANSMIWVTEKIIGIFL